MEKLSRRRSSSMSGVLHVGVSATALLAATAWAAPALAQDEPQLAQSAAEDEEEAGDIIVTGTRLRQSGFDQPTPTTIIGIEEIQSAAPRQIDDFVNQIPSVAGSMTTRSRSIQASNGTNGISSPSLRGIGTHRTLVLLDGQRSVPVTQTGETDVLSFPQQLIARVDVVTGGASAVYGSDALAGVVNFVLDTEFTGLKLEASGGLTTYGDGWNYKVAGSWGVDFAGDRGHFIVSGEYQWNDGVGQDYQRLADGVPPERDWLYGAPIYVNNPAYTPGSGLPFYISNGNGGAAAWTPGGIIPRFGSPTPTNPLGLINGAVGGTAFTNEGQPYQYNYGICDVGCSYMLGGDWRNADIMVLPGIDPIFERANFFARADFDITDNINIFAQYMRSEGDVWGNHSTRNLTVTLRNDNAFLPASVRQAMVANNQASVSFGTFQEGEVNGGYVERQFERISAGATGDFGAFGKTFDWNLYYQHGESDAFEQVSGNYVTANLTRAVDAVVHPTTGTIVCRVNADTSTTNDDPACHPLNLIGWDNFVDPAAYDYVFERSTRWQTFKQDVISFDIAGEPFDLWAGPVGLAIGAEHRREKTEGRVDALSAANALRTNPLPINGEYDVTEGFIETNLPLLRDVPGAQSLDFNGAVRATEYSTSGFVMTWKAGLTWEPIDSLRFRVTRSRDIRAPSMSELFTQGLNIFFAVSDPWNNGIVNTQALQSIRGNLDLEPEKADTWGVGVVFQPDFVPGLRASVDWYQIKIQDAIGTLNSQDIVNECFNGNQLFCPGVIRTMADIDGNGTQELWVTGINQQPFNFASEEHSGVDFELVYRRPVLDGDLTLRGLVTRFIKAEAVSGLAGAVPIDYLGELDIRAETPSIASLPKWKYRASVGYDTETTTTVFTFRGFGSGKWSNRRIGCTSGCPDRVVGTDTVDDNHAEAAFYVDGTFTYRPPIGDVDLDLFLSVQNIFNKDPAILPRGPGGLAYGTPPTNPSLYDVLGRTFTAGIRFGI